MKILILGSSGFLGGHLFKIFQKEADFTVVGTCFHSKENEKHIRLDVTKGEEVKEVLESFHPDVVIWSLMSKTSEKYLIENGLKNILKYLSAEKKLIFISTNAVFHGGDGFYSEEFIPNYKNSDKPLALYSNAKIDGERMVQQHRNFIIARPGAIYGQDVKGQWDKRISELIERLNNQEEIVKTSNLLTTFVNVEKLANAILKLVRLDYKGILHLGPKRKESYFNFFTRVAKSLNLNDSLIQSNIMTKAVAIENGICLDNSLNTIKCSALLGDIMSET